MEAAKQMQHKNIEKAKHVLLNISKISNWFILQHRHTQPNDSSVVQNDCNGSKRPGHQYHQLPFGDNVTSLCLSFNTSFSKYKTL